MVGRKCSGSGWRGMGRGVGCGVRGRVGLGGLGGDRRGRDGEVRSGEHDERVAHAADPLSSLARRRLGRRRQVGRDGAVRAVAV